MKISFTFILFTLISFTAACGETHNKRSHEQNPESLTATNLTSEGAVQAEEEIAIAGPVPSI